MTAESLELYDAFRVLLNQQAYPTLYQAFQGDAVRKKYQAGEQLVTQDDSLEQMGFLLSGEAEIEIVSADGELLIAEKFFPNSLLNAVSFIDGRTSPATLVAVSDCVVLYLSYAKLRSEPQLNLEATLIAGLCAASLYRISEKLLSASLLLPLEERIMIRLQRLKDEDNSVSITAEKLAAYLAVSKHRVHRSLKLLEEKGSIINTYGSVQLIETK
ncbi:cyclic nucleotide-binding domain-containing protein [Vibrio sp. SCSIO 43136]|uniref:Crp/Fnr family transcriptional regulator n=1 Tax=Vibrio sp. SCSIO 43136 TaxID=2819101 RepID=UPI0020758343|nr:cyclic nucleotide-binding domain-containing protein [Vibrio sp. SCSIO 43136]USD68025.1 cyclic nucleotide-binding domain-containing protein [Vibrio sp. SCSIO 43136]